MRNFLPIGISEVIVVKLISKNGVRTFAVQEITVAKLFDAICELWIRRVGWGVSTIDK
jgi:hypothetical protein